MIYQVLRKFINSRPGFEFANYGDVAAYRADVRTATRQRSDALELLRMCEQRGIDDQAIAKAAESAFSGRLSVKIEGEKIALDYCAGQYYCTEYRKAVAVVLASALWAYWRDDGADSGDAIRSQARSACSRGIYGRYFA